MTGESRSGLLRRLAYDPTLENRAFLALADLDVAACRRLLGRLAASLDLDGGDRPEVTLLLLDVLQRINRWVHRGRGDRGSYEQRRADLVESFARIRNAREARIVFLGTLDEMLETFHPGPTPQCSMVERAQAYIRENYQARVSLSKVAEHLNVSANYLSRVFKKNTAVNLTSYLHRVRLEHAMRLLASGERSISEIAYLVGYQNYRDFYRNFVKHKNASPRQVQRELTREAPPPLSPSG
jgi:AraC-like DNA-binding protein